MDYDGAQYWSDVISIIPHEENSVDLQLELLAASLTNDPNPDRFDGVPPVYEPEKIMVASLGSIRGFLVQSVVGQTTEGQKIYYFINDHLGTPQKLLNESADVVWSADYKPFGEADVYVNTSANRFRFPGQYFDSKTGLHYNYHRYYDTSTGKYLRADPIGLAGGINPFLYSLNNPINLIDPLGLWTLGYDASVTAGAGAGTTAGYTWVIDSKGNVAKIRHSGAGGFGGISAGGAAQFQVTNAPTINNLAGTSISTGGSFGPKFVEATGEWIVMSGGYQGANFGVGASVGPSPIEIHSMVEYSDIVWQGNLLDIASEWIGGVFDNIFGDDPCK